jgi:phage shock protein E
MVSRHKLIAVTLFVGLGLTSCGSSKTSSPPTAATASPLAAGHQMLTPPAADSLLRGPPSNLVIVDVRTPAEFAAGHIAGAVDIDLNSATFAGEVAKLDPKLPYFVYCHSGNRSAKAVAYMQQHDFGSIYELQGGIAAWLAAGLQVTVGGA